MEVLSAVAGLPVLGTPLGFWLLFMMIVAGLLAFDLGVLHRDHHVIGIRESLLLSAGYISVGLVFGLLVWHWKGADASLEYYTGFLIEKSLSMDNVFVMALIFGFFGIPRQYQHEVLFWGILGVVLLRALMIGLGTALISEFHWVMYIFGAFLVLTGLRMLKSGPEDEPDLARNPFIGFLRRHLRITPALQGGRFFVRLPDARGRQVLWATPLLLTLVMIECADVVFAVDSVPAIFAITLDPFVIYTSNIFAILGLRALYFALAAMIHRFAYLKYALALVLVFIGGKIFLVNVLGKIPAPLSLGITFGLLAAGVLLSLWKTRSAPATAARDIR